MLQSPERRKGGAIDAIVHTALVEANGPVSAYGLVRFLFATVDKVSAPLVFRALARLIAARRVARIECWSRYVATDAGCGIDLLCTNCQGWQRLTDASVHYRLTSQADANGFTVSRIIVEVNGVCGKCAACRSDSLPRIASTPCGHVVSSHSSI